jgi:hypothetical protein
LWLALSSIPRQSTESLASLEDTLEGAALVWEAGILPMMDVMDNAQSQQRSYWSVGK